MKYPEFSKKVVLITGVGGEIGKRVAEHFMHSDAIVLGSDSDLARAERAGKLFEQSRIGKYYPWKIDVTDERSVESTINCINQTIGTIDILVNCAGVSSMCKIVDMDISDWDHNFNVNAKGVFLTSKHVAIQMIHNHVHGKIVSIASMAGKLAAPYLVHYSASKFAVVGFTQGLALELAPYNINVNAVCPAFVQTEMQEREIQWEAQIRGITPEEVLDGYIKMTPLGRLEQPEDVAKLVCFLASHEADFITGQSMNVTGGALLV